MGSLTCIASSPDCKDLEVVTSSFSDSANVAYTGMALLLLIAVTGSTCTFERPRCFELGMHAPQKCSCTTLVSFFGTLNAAATQKSRDWLLLEVQLDLGSTNH